MEPDKKELYEWLPFHVEGKYFPTLFNAIEAVRCPDPHWIRHCQLLSPEYLAKMSGNVESRPGWDTIKDKVIEYLRRCQKNAKA